MLTQFDDFADATFRLPESRADYSPVRGTMVKSLVYRLTLCRRNDVRWIGAFAWRMRSQARGVAELKQVKKEIDQSVLAEAALSSAAVITEIFGEKPVGAITWIPCRYSRRPDCFSQAARASGSGSV